MSSGGLTPRAEGFNIASPGNNTNLLTSSITPKEGCALRVTVCLATTSVFNVTITKGATTFTVSLNSGTALTATFLYTFVFGASTSNAYNFQVATTGIIQILQVDEVSEGVI